MKQIIKFALSVVLVTSFGITQSLAQVGKLDGRLVGTVTDTNGKTIYLTEHLNYGLYSIAAVSKSNGKYVEEKAFKVKKNYQSVINSVKHYEKWISSNPESGFFAFNQEDNSLYLPLFYEYYDDSDCYLSLCGLDRYIVYQFDGLHFVCKDTNAAGYWLHPSIQNFEYLLFIGRTKDYLIRIDRMNSGDYLRYATWDNNNTMKDEPSIILFDRGDTGLEYYEFNNGNFKYVIDSDNKELRVYEGEKLLKRQEMEVLY